MCPPALRHSGTQALRHSGTQALRHSGTQALRYSGTQVLRYSGTQVLRYSGTQVLRYSGTQVLRYSGTQVLRYSGTQVLRYSEKQSRTMLDHHEFCIATSIYSLSPWERVRVRVRGNHSTSLASARKQQGLQSVNSATLVSWMQFNGCWLRQGRPLTTSRCFHLTMKFQTAFIAKN